MKSISFPQTIIIAVLMLVAMVGVFSVPNENLAIGEWLLTFTFTKAVGIYAGYRVLRMLGAFKN